MSFGPFFSPFSSSLSFFFRVLTSSVILSTDSLANRSKKATSTWRHAKKAGVNFKIRIFDQKALPKRTAAPREDIGKARNQSLLLSDQRIVIYYMPFKLLSSSSVSSNWHSNQSFDFLVRLRSSTWFRHGTIACLPKHTSPWYLTAREDT